MSQGLAEFSPAGVEGGACRGITGRNVVEHHNLAGTRNTARVFRNAVSDEVLRLQAEPNATFEDVRPLVSGARGRAALESGAPENGLLWAGQAIGIIDDVPSCAELIERIVTECRSALERGSRLMA